MNYSFLFLPSLYNISSILFPLSLSGKVHNQKTSCTFYDPLLRLYLSRQPYKSNTRPAWDIFKQQTPHSASTCSFCCFYTYGSVLLAHPSLPLMVKAFVIRCGLINSNGTLAHIVGRIHVKALKKKQKQNPQKNQSKVFSGHCDGKQTKRPSLKTNTLVATRNFFNNQLAQPLWLPSFLLNCT